MVTEPPSSVPLVVVQGTPRAAVELNWDLQTPITLMLAPAGGHRPGIYHVSAPVVVKQTTGAGIINWSVTFNAPGFGPAHIDSPVAIPLTTTGVDNEDVVEIVTDGTAPILWIGTPLGATPPALADVYATAFLFGLLP